MRAHAYFAVMVAGLLGIMFEGHIRKALSHDVVCVESHQKPCVRCIKPGWGLCMESIEDVCEVCDRWEGK